MFLTIVHIIAVFFSIVGLACCIRGIYLNAVTVNDSARYIYIILKDSGADIKLSSAIEIFEYLGSDLFAGIIALDYGLDCETAKRCKVIADENPCVELYTSAELAEILRGENTWDSD